MVLHRLGGGRCDGSCFAAHGRASFAFLVRELSRLGVNLWIGLLCGDYRRLEIYWENVADASGGLL